MTPNKKTAQRRLFDADAEVADAKQRPVAEALPNLPTIDFNLDDISPRKVPRTPSRSSATPNRRAATPQRVPRTPVTVPSTPCRLLEDFVLPPETPYVAYPSVRLLKRFISRRTCSRVDRLTAAVKQSQEFMLPPHLEQLHAFFDHMDKVESYI